MAFVIALHVAFRRDEQQPVEPLAVLLHSDAAGDSRAQITRLLQHPGLCRSRLGLSYGAFANGKRAREHFRQDNQIRGACQWPEPLLQQNTVGIRILPGKVGLDQCKAQRFLHQ